MLSDQSVGVKDIHAPIFAAWKDVFFGSPRKKTSQPGNNQSWNSLSAVSLGDMRIFVDGLFENFSNIRIPDATMAKTAAALDLFSSCANIQHSAVMKSQYQLLRYAQILPITLRSLYRQSSNFGRRTITFPYTAIEMRQQYKKNSIVLRNLWVGMHFQARPSSEVALLADCLSHLLRICCPKLEIASGHYQQVAPDERKQLKRLIDIWHNLGIAPKKSVVDTGSDRWMIDPPVGDLVNFSGMNFDSVPLLRRMGLLTSRVLATQLSRRRALDGPNGEGFTKHTQRKVVDPQQSRGTGGLEGTEGFVPSSKWKDNFKGQQKSKTKETDVSRMIKPKIAKGGFLRGVGVAKSKRRRRNRNENKAPVVFRYQSGFSNAVRRTVVLEDIL